MCMYVEGTSMFFEGKLRSLKCPKISPTTHLSQKALAVQQLKNLLVLNLLLPHSPAGQHGSGEGSALVQTSQTSALIFHHPCKASDTLKVWMVGG